MIFFEKNKIFVTQNKGQAVIGVYLNIELWETDKYQPG